MVDSDGRNTKEDTELDDCQGLKRKDERGILMASVYCFLAHTNEHLKMREWVLIGSDPISDGFLIAQ